MTGRPATARYMVRAWRLVKNPAQLPQRDWTDGGYSAIWQDGEAAAPRPSQVDPRNLDAVRP